MPSNKTSRLLSFGTSCLVLTSFLSACQKTDEKPLRPSLAAQGEAAGDNTSGEKADADATNSETINSKNGALPSKGSAPRDSETSDGPGFSLIVSEELFNSLFPNRNPYYNYADLKAVADADVHFAKEGDEAARRREVAAFLANADHETTGLIYLEEIAMPEYCVPSAAAPCKPGKKYYGRGPMQLSWNFNYAKAGRDLGLPLLEDPDLITRDAKVGWRIMLWYWMTQKGPSDKPSHEGIVKHASFGDTIRAINGVLECNGKESAKVESRISSYKKISALVNVDPGAQLECKDARRDD